MLGGTCCGRSSWAKAGCEVGPWTQKSGHLPVSCHLWVVGEKPGILGSSGLSWWWWPGSLGTLCCVGSCLSRAFTGWEQREALGCPDPEWLSLALFGLCPPCEGTADHRRAWGRLSPVPSLMLSPAPPAWPTLPLAPSGSHHIFFLLLSTGASHREVRNERAQMHPRSQWPSS